MRQANVPLYKEVTAQIVGSLMRGEWKPGELMPSETQLAQKYEVGISTVRQALQNLVADQVLVRRQGKGTFVALHSNPRQQYRFHNIEREDGAKDIPFRELLSLREIGPPREVARRLALDAVRHRQHVYHLKCLSRSMSEAVMITDVFLPASSFHGLSERDFPDGTQPLYGIYQTRFHVNVIRMQEELTAVGADAAVSELLGVPRAAPLLKMQRVAFTFNNVAAEFRISLVNTRHVRYVREQGTAY